MTQGFHFQLFKGQNISLPFIHKYKPVMLVNCLHQARGQLWVALVIAGQKCLDNEDSMQWYVCSTPLKIVFPNHTQ